MFIWETIASKAPLLPCYWANFPISFQVSKAHFSAAIRLQEVRLPFPRTIFYNKIQRWTLRLVNDSVLSAPLADRCTVGERSLLQIRSSIRLFHCLSRWAYTPPLYPLFWIRNVKKLWRTCGVLFTQSPMLQIPHKKLETTTLLKTMF